MRLSDIVPAGTPEHQAKEIMDRAIDDALKKMPESDLCAIREQLAASIETNNPWAASCLRKRDPRQSQFVRIYLFELLPPPSVLAQTPALFDDAQQGAQQQ